MNINVRLWYSTYQKIYYNKKEKREAVLFLSTRLIVRSEQWSVFLTEKTSYVLPVWENLSFCRALYLIKTKL